VLLTVTEDALDRTFSFATREDGLYEVAIDVQ
jgi:hypothetical protein